VRKTRYGGRSQPMGGRLGRHLVRATATLAALVACAMVAPAAAQARNELVGYNGNATLTGTMGCPASETCLAYAYEGAAYTVSVSGTIKEFWVDHSNAGGSGQSVALVLIEPSTGKVVKISEFLSLSSKAETQKFVLASPVDAQRGETLAVAVHPGSGAAADNVFATGSYAGGASAECQLPTAGSVISQCYAASPTEVVAVQAYVEDLVKPPTISTPYSLLSLGPFEATIEAEVNPEGQATTAFIEYGTSKASLSEQTREVLVGNGNTGAPFSQVLQNLLPETTYYVRVVASNYNPEDDSGDVTKGEIEYFETGPAPAPTIEAQEAPAALSATSAKLSATVDAEGAATEFKVLYGPAANALTSSTPPTVISTHASEPYAPTLTGLTAATTYFWKIVAFRKGAKVAETPTHQFTTYRPPAVALGTPTNVGQTSVTLNGLVTTYGVPTSYRFEYGTTAAYGSSTPTAEVGSANGANPVGIAANITGLAPDTIYHYRLVAESAGGQTATADGTFSTAKELPPEISGLKLVDLSPFEAILDFTVNPEGYPTTISVQWGTTTAYGNTTEGGTTPIVGPIALDWSAEDALSPDTTYHLRVVATNRWGTTYSPDQTFTTPPLAITFLTQEFGMPAANAIVPVSVSEPLFEVGSRFGCPPACHVEAQLEAIGPHHKRIKLGKASFTVPRDKKKHKLAIRLSHKAVALLRHHRRLHIKVRYKIKGSSPQSKSTTIIANLTLKGTRGGRHRRR